jgi:hypothetical protein
VPAAWTCATGAKTATIKAILSTVFMKPPLSIGPPQGHLYRTVVAGHKRFFCQGASVLRRRAGVLQRGDVARSQR